MDYKSLKSRFPTLKIEKDYPLAPLTTLNIGGPADIYLETSTNEELVSVLQYIGEVNDFSARSERERMSPKVAQSEAESASGGRTAKIVCEPITIIGNGSNVLISDSGLRGLVIKNRSNKITIHKNLSSKNLRSKIYDLKSISTHRTENEPEKYLNFAAIDYDESNAPTINVTLDAGVLLPKAIDYLLNQGITGLQWFAYIPGTIGGATWGNLHGGKYHFSSYIKSVEYFDLLTSKTNVIAKTKDEVISTGSPRHPAAAGLLAMTWDYESSPFQLHPEWIILSTTLTLYLGDTTRAKETAKAWITQKSKIQPMNSAGCTFQNPPLNVCQKIWGEQKSTGWIIDHELGWKGKSIGGAQISEKHTNFIVNTDSATAKDYLSLVNLIKTEFKTRWNIDLKLEVKLLGNFS